MVNVGETMYHTLFKWWAKEQGFETWAKDHAAVLNNLAQWLEKQNIDPVRFKERLQFRRHLNQASRIVLSLPKWKRNFLGKVDDNV